MATLASPPAALSIPGECTLAGQRIPIRITDLTCDGCNAELPDAGDDLCSGGDFCKLDIAGQVLTNGRVTPLGGTSARIAFFGHIHPVAVEKLRRAAR